jgi:hypothetical protein
MLQDPQIGPLMRLPRPGQEMSEEDILAGRPPLKPTPQSSCRSLHQSLGWYEATQGCAAEDPEWGEGGCNIAVAYFVDGIQPFKRGNITVTPLIGMVLNLPENLRHRPEHMLLIGLIARSEPKNQNPYTSIVVDELLQLHHVGMRFADPSSKLQKCARVKLLFTCADYPAHSHLNLQHVSGFYGCHKCDVPVSEEGGGEEQ